MATTSTAPAPEPESNSIARIFGALFSPGATLRSIARKPTWLPPIILVTLLSVTVVAIFGRRVGWESYIRRQAATSSRFQQLTTRQQEQAIQTRTKVLSKVVYGAAVVAPFIEVAVLAAIFLAVFNLIGGTRIKFGTSLGIVAYSWTPAIISGLLGIVILFLKDPSTVDLGNLLATNAGAFLSSDSPRWLISLLGSLDVLSFWMMSLMAIGYSAAAPKKLSFGKAFFYIFAVWFVYVLAKVGATAAFS
jgi:hypothetical protein